MKVLFITGIFPPDIGGPATYVPVMARALSERGHRVKVLTTSEPHDMKHNDGGFPFPVARVNRRLSLWRRTVDLIRQIIRLGRDADVIYANGMHFEAVLANKFIRQPLVMKIVGDEAWERATRKGWTTDGFEDFQNKRQNWPAELNKRLRSWVTRRADRVIVPSEYLKRHVIEWGVPEGNCVVVYNAVEPPKAVAPVVIPLATPVKLVTVGRLVPWKHVDGIIESLRSLTEAGLVVVGDGPERRRLETTAQSLGVINRVYFAEQRSKSETQSLIAACDIFVLNSSYEGLPHVVVEAMQLGLPVVATAVGGTPEVIKDGETGLLIPPGDNDALSKALRLLIKDTNLRKRLAENAQTALNKFSYPVMVAETEAAFMKIITDVKGNETQ
ncbi:MAG: glycosyltransferase family 4 protein [Bacillota bacterium]